MSPVVAILNYLSCEKTKGKTRVTARTVIMGLVVFIAVKEAAQDKRLMRIESRLGITNESVTVTIPFVQTLQTNNNHIVKL